MARDSTNSFTLVATGYCVVELAGQPSAHLRPGDTLKIAVHEQLLAVTNRALWQGHQ